ncbi:hypothetical protein RB195_019856 [Necator americanus]|uniref:Uncharacterized protein n=2 Tax=Necator americanus TaxID=51031 RepID=A0ABR1CIJ2_NECAM
MTLLFKRLQELCHYSVNSEGIRSRFIFATPSAVGVERPNSRRNRVTVAPKILMLGHTFSSADALELARILILTIYANSKPQEMKWSFILFFVALICAGVFEAAAAGDKKGSINRPWMGGFPTDSPQ